MLDFDLIYHFGYHDALLVDFCFRSLSTPLFFFWLAGVYCRI